MAELKTKKTSASVADFIASVPEPEKRKDATSLAKLFKEITGEKPVMWGETGAGPRRKGAGPTGPSRGRAKLQQQFMRGPSIIGFGQYHYKSERSTQEGDWPMAAFSPRKANLTLYVLAGYEGYDALLKKLGPHTTGKVCLYIKRLSDVDMSVLKKIITKGFVYMKKHYPKRTGSA